MGFAKIYGGETYVQLEMKLSQSKEMFVLNKWLPPILRTGVFMHCGQMTDLSKSLSQIRRLAKAKRELC